MVAKAKASKTVEMPAEPARKVMLTVMGTSEWRAWARGLSIYARAPLSVLVEQSLCRLARDLGYREAPDRKR
jgi:hypothetical protein